jgi:hypothetical protein
VRGRRDLNRVLGTDLTAVRLKCHALKCLAGKKIARCAQLCRRVRLCAGSSEKIEKIHPYLYAARRSWRDWGCLRRTSRVC